MPAESFLPHCPRHEAGQQIENRCACWIRQPQLLSSFWQPVAGDSNTSAMRSWLGAKQKAQRWSLGGWRDRHLQQSSSASLYSQIEMPCSTPMAPWAECWPEGSMLEMLYSDWKYASNIEQVWATIENEISLGQATSSKLHSLPAPWGKTEWWNRLEILSLFDVELQRALTVLVHWHVRCSADVHWNEMDYLQS